MKEINPFDLTFTYRGNTFNYFYLEHYKKCKGSKKKLRRLKKATKRSKRETKKLFLRKKGKPNPFADLINRESFLGRPYPLPIKLE